VPLRGVAPALRGLELGIAAYWAEGEDRRSGEVLDDVGPPTATLTLAWTSPAARWQATLAGTFAASHERAASEVPPFEAPGRGVLDLLVGWRPTERLALNAAIFNLGDKTWWRWSEVRGLPAGDPLVPALSAPGRSAAVSMSYGFGIHTD
jgi:hemoglobin/transferrin/lactoferrin receptor protein